MLVLPIGDVEQALEEVLILILNLDLPEFFMLPQLSSIV